MKNNGKVRKLMKDKERVLVKGKEKREQMVVGEKERHKVKAYEKRERTRNN